MPPKVTNALLTPLPPPVPVGTENPTDRAIQALQPLKIIEGSQSPKAPESDIGVGSSEWELVEGEAKSEWYCVPPEFSDDQKKTISHFRTALKNLIEGFWIQTPQGKRKIEGFWDQRQSWHLADLLGQLEKDLKALSIIVNGNPCTSLDDLLKILQLPLVIEDLKNQPHKMPSKIRIGICAFFCTLQQSTASLCIYMMEKKHLTQTQFAVIGKPLDSHPATRIDATYDLAAHTWKTRVEQDLDLIDSNSAKKDRVTVIAEISSDDTTFTWSALDAPAKEAQQSPQIPPR